MTDSIEAPSNGRKPKPTIAERARQATCPECGKDVKRRTATGPRPTFCSNECKRRRGNRRLSRGSNLTDLLQAWRIDRGSGPIAQAAFAQICQIVDLYNEQDLAAGRPRADLMAAKIMANGSLFIDRQRLRRPRQPTEPVEAPEPAPDPYEDILRQIADGHNDARALAAEALALRAAAGK